MQSKASFRVLNIDSILPNRFQPRLKFEDDSLDELANSISKFGVIEPIVVRPIGDKYEIIAGERRYKASKLASMSTIPSIVVDLSDKDSEELALLENVQRQQLNPIEEAVSYRRILDMGYVDRESLAKKIGKPQSSILAKIRLLNLADEVQSYLLNNKISERHARALLNISDLDDQVSMLYRIVNERLTVKQTNREIKKYMQEASGNSLPESVKGVNSDMDIDKIMRDARDINVDQPAGDSSPAPDLMARDNMPAAPVNNSEVMQDSNPASFDSMFASPVNLVPTSENNNDLLNEVSNVATSQDFNDSVNSGMPLGDGGLNNVSDLSQPVIPTSEPNLDIISVPDTSIIGDAPVNPGMVPEGPAPMNPGMMPEGPAPMNPGMVPEGPAPMNPGMVPEGPAPMNPGMMPEGPAPMNPGIMPEGPAPMNPGMMPEGPAPMNPGMMPEGPAPMNPQSVSEVPAIPDFANIIKQLRDCADQIEKAGHFVNLEEVDLGSQYKVIFTFDK